MFGKFIVKKSGFSIAEALIAMLIIAMVAMLSAPIITKKKKVMEANAVHGKWVCYYDKNSGQFKYGTAADIDSDVKKWKKGNQCKFPVLSPSVRFLWVEVFGAGGGGSRGWAEPWVDKYRYYSWGDPVENEGLYEIEFKFDDYKMVRPEWDTQHSLFNTLYNVDKNHDLHKTYCSSTFPDGKHSSFHYDDKDDHKHNYGTCKGFSYSSACAAVGESLTSLTTTAKYNLATDNGAKGCFYKEAKIETIQVECTCGSDDEKCTRTQDKIECTDGKKIVNGTATDDACTCSDEKATTCVIQKEVCKKDKDNEYWTYETPSGTFKKASELNMDEKHQYCRTLGDLDFDISSSKYPPYEFTTINEILSSCKSHKFDGKSLNECKIDGDSVTHYTYTYFCKPYSYQDLKSYAYFSSWKNYGVKGTLELKPGETVYWKVISEGEFKSLSELQDSKAYPLKKKAITRNKEIKQEYAKDGDTIGLYHRKNVTLGADKFDQQDILIATLKGPTTGQLGKSSGDKCCTNCGDFVAYPNSKYYNRTQCAVNGKDVEVKIEAAYKSRFSTISAKDNQFRIKEQAFLSGTGCYGGNGSSSSSLVPASKGSAYNFQAGRGGVGAKGYSDKPDNRVKKSATEGEPSYFSWVSADGGAAASDSCNNRESAIPARPNSANIYNSSLGLGGSPGGVTKHQNPPKRDYSLSVSEDTHPHMPKKRWSVQDGGEGTGGMIVVSW